MSNGGAPHFHSRIIATLFYEPSTRTCFSFETALYRPGGSVICTENAAEFSSVVKGERLEDTVRVWNGYTDVLVIRITRLDQPNGFHRYRASPQSTLETPLANNSPKPCLTFTPSLKKWARSVGRTSPWWETWHKAAPFARLPTY